MGTCRIINLVGKLPEREEHVIVKQAKNSYAPEIDGIAYEFGTEDLQQKNGNMVEISFLTKIEEGIKIPNPTILISLKGESDGSKGPSPEKKAEAAEFLQEALAAGAMPVNDVYRCKANPDGVMADGTIADHLSESTWTGRKCGHMSLKQVEAVTPQGGSHQCPHCGSAVHNVPGLKTLAENKMIANGTIKRAKAALEVDTDCKGFGTERVQFWTLPDDHPSIDIASPGNEVVPLYDAVGNPELDENGAQIMVARAKPIA
jgi:hypothetical protein